MVLIWGGLRPPGTKASPASKHVVEMVYRSRVLLQDLEDKGERIIIPTVVVAELVTPLDAREQGEFIAVLQKRFFCPPFDLRAAALAGQLWQSHRQLPRDQQLQRSVLKMDVLIIAAAKVAGASVFYSHDEKSRKLAARAGMKALDLPTHSEDLFIDAAMKEGALSETQPPSRASKRIKKR
jgi:hypothetical protein